MASNSCINKMLALNTVGYDKHVSQLNPESVELPTQAEFYPGVSELASHPYHQTSKPLKYRALSEECSLESTMQTLQTRKRGR